MKKYFLILLIFVSVESFPQVSNVFCDTINPFGTSQTDIYHVHECDSFYIAEGIYHGMGGDRFFIKFDKSGGIIHKKIYPDSAFGMGSKYSNFFVWYNSSFININSVYDTGSTKSMILVAYDYNFDTLWTKKYSSLNAVNSAFSNYPMDIKETPDGGYLVAGQLNKYYSISTRTHPFLMKIDNIGNIQWFKRYENYIGFKFFKLEITPDMGILIYCNKLKGTLIKMNALGVIEKTIVINNLSNYFDLSDISYTGNNTYTIARAYSFTNDPYSALGLNVVKVNSYTMSVMWDKTYFPAMSITQYPNLKVHLVSNGNIMISGSCYNETHYPWGNPYYIDMGFVFDLGSNGDSLNIRRYTAMQTNNLNHWLNDLEITSDGGFLGGGDIAGNHFHSAWIFKTDANGVIGFQKRNIDSCENTKIKIFPNPSTNYVAFEFENFSKYRMDLVIYNSIGQIVKQRIILEGIKNIVISTKGLDSGLYYFSFINSNRTFSNIYASGKFIQK